MICKSMKEAEIDMSLLESSEIVSNEKGCEIIEMAPAKKPKCNFFGMKKDLVFIIFQFSNVTDLKELMTLTKSVLANLKMLYRISLEAKSERNGLQRETVLLLAATSLEFNKVFVDAVKLNPNCHQFYTNCLTRLAQGHELEDIFPRDFQTFIDQMKRNRLKLKETPTSAHNLFVKSHCCLYCGWNQCIASLGIYSFWIGLGWNCFAHEHRYSVGVPLFVWPFLAFAVWKWRYERLVQKHQEQFENYPKFAKKLTFSYYKLR